MKAVSVEEIRDAIRKKYGTGFIPLRECSICNETIGYFQEVENDRLWFDSSCGCASGVIGQDDLMLDGYLKKIITTKNMMNVEIII